MLQTRGNRLTWLGHAAFRIDTPSGKVILVDPWIQTNPMCPEANKKFDRVDTMLITHGHFDHIADAVDLGKKFNPQIVGIYELCAWLESKGVPNTNAMNKGGTQKIGEIEVTMVNAVHSCAASRMATRSFMAARRAATLSGCREASRSITRATPRFLADMKLIGELYAPDVALLPIGDHYTMGPREAAMAIRFLNVRHVIPMHFGTFPSIDGQAGTSAPAHAGYQRAGNSCAETRRINRRVAVERHIPRIKRGARMPGILEPAVEKYMSSLLPARDAVLADMESYAKQHDVAIIGPDCGRLLSLMAQISGAKRIFEMGSAIGYSAIWFARAAGPDGENFLHRRRSGQCEPGPQELRTRRRCRAHSIHDRRRGGID